MFTPASTCPTRGGGRNHPNIVPVLSAGEVDETRLLGLTRAAAKAYPVPRRGTACEVADLISFAASEAAGYITGASLDIHGGALMT